jgi:hypothetical protein
MDRNPFREALLELRFHLGHAARQRATDKDHEAVALDKRVCPALGKFARVGVETGNAALFHTAIVMTYRYCSSRGIDAATLVEKLTSKWGMPPLPVGVCTICGRFWRSGDPGWRTWKADGDAWGGEVFATCSADCAQALLTDSMPGYASFASERELAQFTQGTVGVWPELLSADLRRKPEKDPAS